MRAEVVAAFPENSISVRIAISEVFRVAAGADSLSGCEYPFYHCNYITCAC